MFNYMLWYLVIRALSEMSETMQGMELVGAVVESDVRARKCLAKSNTKLSAAMANGKMEEWRAKGDAMEFSKKELSPSRRL